MSNNSSQIEKLVLKGHFERSEKAKQETIEDLNLSRLSAKQQKSLAFMNQNFKFEVNILDLDLDSGLFIAKGNDIFGTSVIDGTIKQGHHGLKYGAEIDFKKKYIGDPKHDFPVQRPASLNYIGWMEVSEKKISCSGTYETHSGFLEGGTWELNSVKEST
jgi:hypothetical protein